MVDTSSWSGAVAPPELVDFIVNKLVGGSPFANHLTPYPAERGTVHFATVSPDGFDWTGEGQPIPDVDPNDALYAVSAAKLAGIISLTNEMMSDSAIDLSSELARAVQDSMSAKLDDGLLHGNGTPPNPLGILGGATAAAAGPDLRTAVINAWGELIGAGGAAESIIAFVSPIDAATEMARVATGSGEPVHEDGAAPMLGPGIRMVPVAMLDAGETLVADVSRLYLVRRQDFNVALSPHAGFSTDSTAIRITGRFAVAAPAPAKSIRKAVIDD